MAPGAALLALALLAGCSRSNRPVGDGPDTSGETGQPDADDSAEDTEHDTGSLPDPFVLYLAVDGDDANPGTSPEAPLASLERAHALLLERGPPGEVQVRVAPGTYRCRGMVSDWTFRNGHRVSLLPLEEVPGPAADSAEDPGRPWFEGRDAAGENCEESVWLTVRHAGEPMPLTIEGLAVTRYRGGLSLKPAEGTTTDPDLGIEVRNMVFSRVGDRYHTRWHADGSWLEGKGAILVSASSGCTFADNWFDHVRNLDGTAGLIHAIYLSSGSSRHRIEGNTFHSCSGVFVKISDYSNGNAFLDNHFSYGQLAVRDRWCGALEDPAESCGGQADCPSWENSFPFERNTWGNLEGDDPVKVLDVPDGQTCDHAPPASNVRMDLGTGGVVYGP